MKVYFLDQDEDGNWWICDAEDDTDFGPYDTEGQAREDGDMLTGRRSSPSP